MKQLPALLENHPHLWHTDLPKLRAEGNKYTRGHALVMGGYPMTGAARLAARAAARSGAGLTTVAVPEVAFPIYAAALISIIVIGLPPGVVPWSRLEGRGITGILAGMGVEPGSDTRAAVIELLAVCLPMVLDAGALMSFAGQPDTLRAAIHGTCVLTPHEGEFTRLFGGTGDRLGRVRQAARQVGAVVILKGPETLISAPDGRTVVQVGAPATLATAGSGDVLGGIVLGFLAQGMDPFLAAAAAVWLHASAAAGFGLGLIAEDLPDLLPAELRRLEALEHR